MLTDQETVEPLKRVKVNIPFRVVHDGTAYSGGDVAIVPESMADTWLLNRWVEVAE